MDEMESRVKALEDAMAMSRSPRPSAPATVPLVEWLALAWEFPPVPDTTKDYIWGYDHSDHTMKWIETTTGCP
jgi:hypothetical protein